LLNLLQLSQDVLIILTLLQATTACAEVFSASEQMVAGLTIRAAAHAACELLVIHLQSLINFICAN